MTVVAHLSDPHLDGSPERAQRLRAALVHATGGRRPAGVVVLSGDVADGGTPDQYAQVREVLADCPVPVLAVPGNHDGGTAFAEGLLGTHAVPPGRVEEVAGARFVLLDSTVAGSDGGALSTTALDVLGGALGDAERDGWTGPLFVVLHHPPVPLGDPGLDAIGLAGPEAFAAVLDGRPGVTAVLAGHAHVAAATTVAGVPVVLAPAVSTAFRMPWERAEGAARVDPAVPPGLAFEVVDDTGRLSVTFATVPGD